MRPQKRSVVDRSVRYSISILFEASERKGAHADKETKHINIFEYLQFGFQTKRCFWNDYSLIDSKTFVDVSLVLANHVSVFAVKAFACARQIINSVTL